MASRFVPITVTLATRNLFHDRVRLVATVVGIVFSIILVIIQIGLFLGFERMVTTMIDRADADIWVVPRATKSFEDPSLVDERERYRALPVTGVASATPIIVGFTQWRRGDGAATPIFLVGSDPRGPGLRPWSIVEGGAEALVAPFSVAVDRTYSDRLGIETIGETGEIRDRKVDVAAITKGIRSFTTTPYVFASFDTARALLETPAGQATYVLVRVAPGARVADVRDRLVSAVTDADVLTTHEFRERSRSFWLFGTGAGAALFTGAILGIVVGTVIVAQTLYASTKDHINEFATLRAIGSSGGYIVRVILFQALLAALIGFSIAALAGWIVVLATADTALPVVITRDLMYGLFALTLAMCVISAIAAIREVVRIDPAMVFTR